MRFFLVAVMLGLGVTPIAGGAQEFDTTVEFHHAPEGAEETEARLATPRSGTVVTGAWKIVVSAGASSSLKSFTVSVSPGQEDLPPLEPEATVARGYEVGTTQSDQIILDWNSLELTPHNGEYQIAAIVESHVGGSRTATITELKVNNSPQKPSEVRVAFPENVPTVEWAANPEPDILSYSIQRSLSGEGYKPLGTAKGTRFLDRNVPQDTLIRYRVIALRSSPVSPAAGVASAPSDNTPGFLIPGPGYSRPGVPLTAEALPSPAPQRHSGGRFSQVLPYEGLPPVVPADSTNVLSAPSRIAERTVSKVPFLATSLLFLVAAMHMLRISRRLLYS